MQNLQNNLKNPMSFLAELITDKVGEMFEKLLVDAKWRFWPSITISRFHAAVYRFWKMREFLALADFV